MRGALAQLSRASVLSSLPDGLQRQWQRICAVSEAREFGGALLSYRARQPQFGEVARADEECRDHYRRSQGAADDEKDQDYAVQHDLSHSSRRRHAFSRSLRNP
jgi:hypothetical protein